MGYEEAQVIVKEVRQQEHAAAVSLEFLRKPDGPPVAPGALYPLSDRGKWVFEIHRLVDRAGSVLSFETYDSQLALPRVGERYAFRSWWTQAAAMAVLDVAADWVLQAYPGDYEHCLITWDKIWGGQSARYSARHGWITEDAYRHFIQQDRHRIRANGLVWADL